ncbi:hypothetical protein JW921_11070 [Candidatus Fermentibacterales bacterium]|nr:hypothetical protein [Candidatus Fermentibacterales bacterium]
MATYEVRVLGYATLETTVEIEAENREQAYERAFARQWSEDDFEGEKFYMTGDYEILGVEEEAAF